MKRVKDSKDIARNDKKGKWKAAKEVTKIKKEELGVLCFVATATKEPTNRDNFDLFNKNEATKMRKSDEDEVGWRCDWSCWVWYKNSFYES